MSKKRGQATGFVIVGIVVVVLVLLFFYLRGELAFGPVTPQTFEGRFQDIRDHTRSCLREVGGEPLRRIGLQGGRLRTPEGTFRLHEDIPVSYLCYDIENQATCQNRLLTLTDMQNELAAVIKLGLAQCLDFGKFRGRGYELVAGQQDVSVAIHVDTIAVTLRQPITLRREQLTQKEDTFLETFSFPLGRLYDVSQDILDVETTYGEFDQLSYMLAHKGYYVIEKKKPYPDKLYILQSKDSDYVFQFFVQDEPTS